MESFSIRTIAERLGGSLDGSGEAVVSGVAGVREARPGELAFVASRRYAAAASATRASALLVARDWADPVPCDLIRVDDPEGAFARVVSWLRPAAVVYEPGVHPTAVVAGNAVLGTDVHVGPYCVVGENAVIGDRTVLCAFCYVGPSVRVGVDGMLHAHVSIREYSRIGDRAIIHNGAVIGSDGFGYEPRGDAWEKIPQVGVVEVGADVEIGANVTVDRARFGTTRIGDGVKIDNLVQIAHNVQVGANSAMAAQVGIAGSAVVGEHVQLGGQSGIAGHLTVERDCVVAAKTGVSKDAAAGSVLMGVPGVPRAQFARNLAVQKHLPELKQTVLDLKARLNELAQRVDKATQ